MGKALDDIAAERKRQIEAEGWTYQHDDEHASGELARAASAYALAGSYDEWGRNLFIGEFHALAQTMVRRIFPSTWDWKWWKPTNRRRDLVKAAALLVAEIERLDRTGTRTPQP